MRTLADMRTLLLLVATLLVCDPLPAAEDQDSAVLTAALENFFRSPHSTFGPKEFVIIRRTSSPLPKDMTLEKVGSVFESDKVVVPTEALRDMLERNGASSFIPRLGSVGPAVRYDDRFRAAPQASSELKTHVSTILSLQLPGYAEGQRAAAVYFTFTWSAFHSGRALYVLKRSASGEWQIASHSIQIYL
jgi:hypothetical protein